MFVTIETNSWGDDEGAYLFDTFKEAFDYMAKQINPIFDGWSAGIERETNMTQALSDEDRQYYEERFETDQLCFWCHSKCNEHHIWSDGIVIYLYEIQNRSKP